MKRLWIRRVALAIGGLLLLLLLAVGVLVATFDANRYKPLAIDYVKSHYDRELAIDGPIELTLFPRLAAKVTKVRLSEHGRADEFVAVDDASLSLQLWPLLQKRLVVDRVSARGVRAVYERKADGSRNIDDLVASGAASGPAPAVPGPTPASPALQFDVSAVDLADIQLRLRDEMAKLDGTVALPSFKSGRLADSVATPITLRADVQLTAPRAIHLQFAGSLTLKPDFASNAVALTDIKLDADGDAAPVSALKLALTGAVAWDGQALKAGPLQLTVNSATVGANTLAASTLEADRVVFSPSGEKLELAALTLKLAGKLGKGDKGGNDVFALSLAWPKLAVDARSLSGDALSGDFKLSGANAIAGTFRSRAPSGNFDALALPGVAIDFKGSAGPRKVDGSFGADVVLRIAKKTAAFEKLVVRANLADPALQPLRISVDGKANAGVESADWNLKGAFNDNRFESSGSAAFGKGVPNLKVDARFDDLDLGNLLAADKGKATGAAGAVGSAAPVAPAAPPALGPTPAEMPIALDGLRALDGQFKLTAGALAFRQYRIDSAQVDAALSGGTLRVSRVAGRAWGGSIQGSGSAEAGSRRVAVKLVADGIDVNAMLKAMSGKDLLEGTGRVTADVRSNGATVGAVRSNVDGRVSLDLRDGAIKGIDLAKAFRQAKSALTGKLDAAVRSDGGEKTDFTALSATANIVNGVGTSDDLQLKSPFLRIGGAGRFDIGRGLIDYTARATVIAAPTGQGGADLNALRGITVPVALSGPFEAIAWKIGWSEVALQLAENQLKGKLGERLGKQLGIDLPGLLGGRMQNAPANAPPNAPPGAPGNAEAPSANPPPAKPRDLLRNELNRLFR
ncbi:MAG: AsmA family protein [Variovorax sp.]